MLFRSFEKVRKLFTAEQTALWNEIVGEPFKGDLFKLPGNQFGGWFGPGGFGGFGGPPAGPPGAPGPGPGGPPEE